MIGITLTTDQIRNPPKEVRQWIEHEVIASLATEAPAPQPVQAAHLDARSEEEAAAILAQVRGMPPAVNVFFDFARPGVAFGHPPAMAFPPDRHPASHQTAEYRTGPGPSRSN